MLRDMFMRGLCVASLLIVACFDGGSAPGKPCNADAECGNDKCIDGFCGGAQTTGSTTPSTTEDESSSSTGEPFVCPPPPPDPAICRGSPIGRTVTSYPISDPAYGQVISLVAGNFIGEDALPDLAVLGLDTNALVLVRNDGGGQWMTSTTRLLPDDYPDLSLIDPYDVAVGDLACQGSGNVFVLAGQGPRMGFVGVDEFGFGGMGTVDLPMGSYSVTLADVVTTDGSGALDAIISGNAHVSVIENFGMSYDEFGLFSFVDGVLFPFAVPWDTQVITIDGLSRILVPQGDQLENTPNTPNQVVRSLRIQGNAQPFTLTYATPPQIGETGFNNPWALAVGDFNGDGTDDLAVAERHLDDPDNEEGTSTLGTIRFLSINTLDDLTDLATVEVGVGVNSIAAANFDCDEYMDLVIGVGGPPMMGGEPQILFGAEDLIDAEVVDIGTPGMSPSSRIAIADFDEDGRPEAAIGDQGLNDVAGARFVIVDVN